MMHGAYTYCRMMHGAYTYCRMMHGAYNFKLYAIQGFEDDMKTGIINLNIFLEQE
jgi:hypothetical protein